MHSGRNLFLPNTDNPFGALLTPLTKIPAEIGIYDVIANQQHIYNYLASVNEIQPIENILEQPTPAGMALIASFYNNKKDQHVPIYIASTVADLCHLAGTIAQSEADRAVVIFQPTDLTAEQAKTFYAIHKIVIYFSKDDKTLNVVMADSTPYGFIRQTTIDIIDPALQKYHIPRVYWMQKIAELSNDQHAICLQGDFWSCGTHAFRIARAMAKHKDFLIDLKPSRCISFDDKLDLKVIEYLTPVNFLKLADTQIARDKCRLFYKSFPALDGHFSRYQKDFAYTTKFTRKYLSLLATLLVGKTASELADAIKTSDARHYASTDSTLTLRS